MIKGDIFDGKYRILEILGRGGMGTVYLAENMGLGTFWAIKELNKGNLVTSNFLIEPNILKRLNHPALPRVFDILEDEENIFFVVDFIQGRSLDRELSEAGSFDEGTVLSWAWQLCDVLEYLHTRKPYPIIYRDMKPSNIILTQDGSLKLIDFGIAREYKQESETDTVYIGTKGYAAPEQYGMGQTDERSDIYSLGMTLLHLVTGIPPGEVMLQKRSLKPYKGILSEDFERIIHRCTRLDPAQRYSSVKELKEEIRQLYHLDSSGREVFSTSWEKRSQPIFFTKLFLSIWGNTEFSCELAYVISLSASYRILLINLDFSTGFLDIYLGMRDNLVPGILKRSLAACRTGEHWESQVFKLNDRLHVLTDCIGPEDVDPCENKAEELEHLFRAAYGKYDVVLVNLGKNRVQDEMTMRYSTHCLFVIRGSTDEIRHLKGEFRKYYKKDILNEKKFRVAVVEYKKGINLNRRILSSLYGDALLGCVEYDDNRERFRDAEEGFYSNRHIQSLKKQYAGILQKLGIMPRESLWDKISRKSGCRTKNDEEDVG